MKKTRFLNIKGALLDEKQLEKYLENIASEHIVQKKSNKKTYPINRLENNFKFITKTYELLNSNLKQKINIHPAGEWLIDNYYIIEETYKTIKKELSLKKYVNFVGISNGVYKGFARIYVLASEIVAYTEGKIESENLKILLSKYQNKKTLNMEEIWNISIFFDIALIEKIRNICEKIYSVQLQKYKVEGIIERLVENVEDSKQKFKKNIENEKIEQYSAKETYIEYLSYRLKSYGKKGLPYIKILEEQVSKTGTTIIEVTKKEHYDIALKKVYIGNCIKSIKDIQRINFTKIFEDINGVENILKKDPAKVYEKMDHKTKDYYRSIIKKLSGKTKISEIYITNKALDLAKKAYDENDKNIKKIHIGYYLISDGKRQLESILGIKSKKEINKKNIYIGIIILLTSIIDFFVSFKIFRSSNIIYALITLFLLYIPISEIVIKVIQYILGKVVKPKIIPKIYFRDDIPEKYTTMVVIPTILDSKEKVKEMFKNLEVYFLANKTENLYFTLLGDCTTSSKENENFDDEIIEEGKKQINRLNNKYKNYKFPIFNFIYRKRIWNEKESMYLGWERKRGILSELNQFLLGKEENTFIFNSMENLGIPKIRYIITLDADTKLVLDSAKKLIGAIAHILNIPVLSKDNNIVIEGYGILQPRINIDIESTNKNLFTKIFAGRGGIDFYSNAISDIYQDNFKEGIFTGKGIYDLEIFNKVLNDAIPENTVLSHDLLEGLYLKCGLATDIFLMDSHPTNYSSYITRASRWVRGDWQIIKWLGRKVKNRKNENIMNPLSELDKFKILDNLRRSLLSVMQILGLIFFVFAKLMNKFKISGILYFVLLSIFINIIIELINYIVYKKEGVTKAESFSNNFGNIEGAFFREIINTGTLPYKAYIYIKNIIKTLYRVLKSKRNLLQWITAEEAEKICKNTVFKYIKGMWINILLGAVFLFLSNKIKSISILLIGVLWIFTPFICYGISIPIKKKENKLSKQDKELLLDIAKRTWKYFEDFLTEDNNFLPPDNYQESRYKKVVDRTSSTNIGLGLICVISAYDFGFINLDKCLDLLEKMLYSIKKLPKWNGHLYNWYNIKSLTPLRPEYISTVDSGNFIGYIYIVKAFLMKIAELNNTISLDKINEQIEYIENLIKTTDFSKLYDDKIGLMSIGFSIDENRLTPSYYDLLASEARQASLIAIAKKDVDSEHWSKLSRTLTVLNRKKGLISWSGTAFEYLMPNINIKRYEGSLLDESCSFMIMSQKKYCEKLGIPWGISESAFNLKDLNSNYQYKAFGIPWLGLKRGLADEAVVSSYGSIIALSDCPEDVIKNIKILKKQGMYNKYGFYESIDYTPERLSRDKKYEIVKTYMAHHQALIFLSINNFINNNIMQKRFNNNPEIEAVDILLQEKMPEDVIITKEKKELVEKIKYKGYDSYVARNISKIDERLNNSNVISSEDYKVYFNQDGAGYSKYKNILVNRYKETDREKQGIQIYFKNLNSDEIWSSYILDVKKENYQIEFFPDMNKVIKTNGDIETIIKNIIAPNENVEIRNIKIKNKGNKEQTLEISSVLEPILSTKDQDIAHKAFNNLFLKYEKLEDGLLVKRNKRGNSPEINMAIGMFAEEFNNLEYEIDKEKLYGRLNYGIPNKIINSQQFENKIGLVTDPIVALRKTIKVKSKDFVELNLIISVNEDKNIAVNKLDKYRNFENVKKVFDISKIRTEEEARYLGLKGKDIVLYQKMLSYILRFNYMKKEYLKSIPRKIYSNKDLWKYGISGDNPIILVKVREENDIYTVKEILKAYDYYLSKKINIDLIILDNEANIYEKYIKNEIEREIYNLGINYLIGNKIFILDEKELENIDIFTFKANLILDSHKGNLENIILEMEEEILSKNKIINKEKVLKLENDFEKYNIENMDLKFKNSYGGFETDGLSYIICTDKNIPSVWSNILTNGKFGTIVTQNLGGYTWYKNSRLNRISRWSNDTILDTPSESIFIKDYSENKVWRISDGSSKIKYGFGYVNLEQKNKELKQELDVFVPINYNAKINILKLTNNTNTNKKLNLIYKIDNVLGEDELKTNSYLNLEYDDENDYIKVKNLYEQDINSIMYIYSSEKIKAFTGNNDSINLYGKEDLNKDNSLGRNSCLAIQIEIELNSFEEKEISLVLGCAENDKDIDFRFKDINKCKEELINTKKYWSDMLEKIRINTPDESLNIMLNGWAMYQTITSRLYARSGFNQSGGAYGFRDQLQDCVGLEYLDTNMVKKQIIKHAMHQFIEGDVEHWWHDETGRGIRTKFSDDRLWLVYVVADYIDFTEDYNILEEKIPYIKGKILREDEDENYDLHDKAEYEETIYSHCIRAINVSLKFGKNGLPLIGTGDWNDGLNTVGNKGRGESIWLGFFLYDVLNRFIKIARYKNDVTIIKSYTQILEKLKIALNTNGWDKKWYKRAFTDDGQILGSEENEECKIDSIAQSWAIISGAGDNDKKYLAIDAIEKYLIDKEIGIIKLLDPPFENSSLEPGYIKSYMPGVRENGGQYTHEYCCCGHFLANMLEIKLK